MTEHTELSQEYRKRIANPRRYVTEMRSPDEWVLAYMRQRYAVKTILRNGPRILRACESVRKQIDAEAAQP